MVTYIGQAYLLIEALRGKRPEKAKQLLDSDVNRTFDVNVLVDKGTPIFWACRYGYLEVAKLLLDRGAEVDEIGLGASRRNTALHQACHAGHLEVARLLLDRGAWVDKRDAIGETALHSACKRSHRDGLVMAIETLLLDRGAEVDSASEEGDTPLLYACLGDRLEVVELLLDRGAAVELGNSSGETPLLHACGAGHLEVAELLLDRGAGVNNIDSGETALHMAVRIDALNIVRLLLDRGAEVDMASTNGDMTALRRACNEGFLQIIRLLLVCGARSDIEETPGYPFTDPARLLLHQWTATTLTRRAAVRCHGWEYLDVPFRWTPANHALFPLSFRQHIEALCISMQAPPLVINYYHIWTVFLK